MTPSGKVGFLVFLGLIVAAAAVVFVRSNALAGDRAQVADGEGIAWQDDVADEGLQLVYFTADWCPPCREMKRAVWPDAEVVAAAEGYRPVKIDIDADPATAQQFGVGSIPTMMILRDGERVASQVGGVDAGTMVAWLNKHRS